MHLYSMHLYSILNPQHPRAPSRPWVSANPTAFTAFDQNFSQFVPLPKGQRKHFYWFKVLTM